MIHRTFRSLDDAPKLVGFTVRQWATLIAASAAVLGLIEVCGLATKPAITLLVFVIGLPAALTYVSESGGLQITVLLRSMLGWRCSRHTLPAAAIAEPPPARVVILTADQAADEEPLGEQMSSMADAMAWERWG